MPQQDLPYPYNRGNSEVPPGLAIQCTLKRVEARRFTAGYICVLAGSDNRLTVTRTPRSDRRITVESVGVSQKRIDGIQSHRIGLDVGAALANLEGGSYLTRTIARWISTFASGWPPNYARVETGCVDSVSAEQLILKLGRTWANLESLWHLSVRLRKEAAKMY